MFPPGARLDPYPPLAWPIEGDPVPTVLNPYLAFRGNAREAMEFYKQALGGELEISTFGENQASQDPSEDQLVMHSKLVTTAGFVLMGSDTPERMPFNPGDTVSISLGGDDVEALQGYWDALSDGATVLQPLVEAPWGDSFGMLRDRFGFTWLVNIAGSAAASAAEGDTPTP
jgi:PhnB protein